MEIHAIAINNALQGFARISIYVLIHEIATLILIYVIFGKIDVKVSHVETYLNVPEDFIAKEIVAVLIVNVALQKLQHLISADTLHVHLMLSACLIDLIKFMKNASMALAYHQLRIISY